MDLPNGTLTFISLDGGHYAVTCQHVVDKVRANVERFGSKTYHLATLKDGIYSIGDEFKQPSAPLGSSGFLDIAIERIPPDFPAKIGKRFLTLLPSMPKAPENVPFAVGFGFPTGDKSVLTDERGELLQMPCVQTLAEGITSGTRFLSLLSEVPTTAHLSGMSGGPAFWSEGEKWGLLGFIYEGTPTAPEPNDLYGSPRVQFCLVPCDYQEFSRWVTELNLREGRIAKIRPMKI
jgi:hypothetical protein